MLDEFCQGYPEESQATKVRVVTIVTIAVTIPSIALRCVARYKTSQLGWDDYTAMIAAVCLVIPAIITLISKSLHLHCPFQQLRRRACRPILSSVLRILEGTFLGFGRHVWDVNPRDAIPLLQVRIAPSIIPGRVVAHGPLTGCLSSSIGLSNSSTSSSSSSSKSPF